MKVRTDLIRHAKTMHTWVGITCGIFLFVCFFAGGLSVFQHDLSRWATPPQQQLQSISASQYDPLIQQVQAQYPETIKSYQLNFDSKEFYNAPMQWQIPVSKGQDEHEFDTHQQSMLATLNENGTLQVKQENLSKLGWLIEQLHETAGIPGTLGHHTIGVYVMGVVCILYFLALITGLIVLLPTLVKDYFAIRTGKNKKRFWLDAHNVVGITSFPFHIIISITAIAFAFHDVFYDAIGRLVVQDKPLFQRPPAVKIVEPVAPLNIEKMLEKIRQQVPEYQVSSISFNHLDQPEKASARANLYSADQMLRGDHFDVIVFNPYLDKPLNTSNLNTQATAMDQVIRSMFSLHFGNYGGDLTRWLYLILGLGGAFLFYSGNLLWIESRLRRQKNIELAQSHQRKDVRAIANLTVGACLGCILAVVSSMLIGRWGYILYAELNSLNHLFLYGYYTVFSLSILYSFVVGAGKALPQLLFAIVLVLCCLPLTSVIALIFPQLGIWASFSSLWWIDIFAIIFAGLFIWFYLKAKYRQKYAAETNITP